MNPILHGVVAYEDVGVAKLAKEKWDYVVHTLRDGYQFELQLWKFDILQYPQWRDAAANDAANAQMVFVATRGAGELPAEVKAWIEQWLAQSSQKREAARLLTLFFDPPAGQVEASAFSQFAYLQQAARKGSMDFIACGPATRNKESILRLHAPTGGMRSGEDREDNLAPGHDHAAKREALA